MDVDRICAVYILHIITNSTKSQDIIFKPAGFRQRQTVDARNVLDGSLRQHRAEGDHP